MSSDDPAWGYTVNGAYESKDDKGNTTAKYALNAGGFAGSLQAAILGDKDSAKGTGSEVDTAKDSAALTVTGLRAVESGQYAGGFFGLADVSSVASVGGGEAGKDQNTNLLLKLLKVGNVGVLEAFRTFIYDGQVNGVSDGIQIVAHDSTTKGMLDSKRYTGAVGGFGGGLINGSVEAVRGHQRQQCDRRELRASSGILANPARSLPTTHNSARMRSICSVPRPAYLTSGARTLAIHMSPAFRTATPSPPHTMATITAKPPTRPLDARSRADSSDTRTWPE